MGTETVKLPEQWRWSSYPFVSPSFPVPELWVPRSCVETWGKHGDRRDVHQFLRILSHRDQARFRLPRPDEPGARPRFYLFGEAGAVRVNEGWGKISFRDRVA